MKFKKRDKVRHKEKGGEWFIQGATPGGRVFCRRYTTEKGENEMACFSKEDIEFIRR